MIRYAESRHERRKAKRAAVAAKLAERQARQDPRGDEDRRTVARRADPPLAGAALDRRLLELGLTADRRHNDRRSRDRRR